MFQYNNKSNICFKPEAKLRIWKLTTNTYRLVITQSKFATQQPQRCYKSAVHRSSETAKHSIFCPLVWGAVSVLVQISTIGMSKPHKITTQIQSIHRYIQNLCTAYKRTIQFKHAYTTQQHYTVSIHSMKIDKMLFYMVGYALIN